MANRGFARPRLAVAIWLAVTLAAWLAVLWGTVEMQWTGRETTASALAIGIGFPVGVIATGMLYLAIWGARIVAATRRGEGVIARWHVPPDDLAAFVADNAARNALGIAYGNDWIPPRTIPEAGLDITFRPDGVLVGERYFGLVTTGMFKFEGVQMLPGDPPSGPGAIEFGTVQTSITQATTVHINRSRGVLRLPVPRLARAEAARVLDHYRKVDAREIIVNPGFYLGRRRFGLYAALACFAVATLGFALEFIGGKEQVPTWLPVSLAVGGLVAGLGGLVLAAVAWHMSRAQHRRRR